MCDITPGLLAITLCPSRHLNLHISSAQSRGHLFTKFSAINKVEISKWIKFKDYDHLTFQVYIRL